MATAAVSTASDEAATPAVIAHSIRDRLAVLANALELIRLGDDPVAALRLATRQLDALARLADALHDPARGGCPVLSPIPSGTT